MNELKNTDESRDQLLNKIDNQFKAYYEKQNEEPIYASCSVTFIDDGSSADVIIKLDSGYDEEKDKDVFFFCSSLSGLKSLCDIGAGKFSLTDLYEFSNDV